MQSHARGGKLSQRQVNATSLQKPHAQGATGRQLLDNGGRENRNREGGQHAELTGEARSPAGKVSHSREMLTHRSVRKIVFNPFGFSL